VAGPTAAFRAGFIARMEWQFISKYIAALTKTFSYSANPYASPTVI
jgi:hypothetical protein